MICSTCKINKSPKSFSFRNKTKNIRNKICKSCIGISRKIYKKNNKEKIRQKDQRRADNLKEAVYNYLLTHPCKECGESEPLFLEFDHINPEDKIATIANLVSNKKSLNTILNEITKCQVLCVKCHRLKSAKEGNYFQYQKYVERNSQPL